MCSLLVISIAMYICTADFVTSDFDHDLVSSGFSILDALIYFFWQERELGLFVLTIQQDL